MKVIQLHNNNIELIKKASKNNRGAQHMIYETYAPKMLSLCRYYIKDIQKAEEVMLNGFFKGFTNLKNFKNEGSFEGWLRKIMVREAISFIRQEKQLEFSMEEENISHLPTYNASCTLELNEIQNYIDALPEGYKIVFVMYVVEGYKHHEIAKLLEISEGTSKSQLYKARQLLQEKIIKSNKINREAHEIRG